MTRLIDADKVAHEIDQLSHAWEYGQAVDDCYEIVKSAPTVDAIPISYIEEQINDLEAEERWGYSFALAILIETWNKEKEKE